MTEVYDPVHHPSHYERGGLECKEVLSAMLTPEQHVGFWLGNSFKYLWRCLYKHHTKEGMAQDIDKAIECLKHLKQLILQTADKAGDGDVESD